MSGSSPATTAAIVAALERFRRATTPGPSSNSDEEAADPWVRAAILEGVARADPGPSLRWPS